MTLGIFTDDFYPFIGGMGRYVHELSKRLPRDRVVIFSPSENGISNHVRIEPVLHRRLRNLSYSWWLHRNIDRTIVDYDLTGANIQCGPGGLFLLRSLDIRVVATCHHTWWQQSHHIPGQFWKRLLIPFERRTYHRADTVICDAADSRRVLVDNYGISPEKVTVIPIGVDSQAFHPIRGTDVIPGSLLFVGRPDRRKGIDFLLRAMPDVVKHIPTVRLYISGTGKGTKRWKRFVREHHLEKHVTFLGFVPESRLNHWYNRVQCVIVPSVFEGFGLTALEAMAAGTAVIATNVDSLRDLVSDGVDGRLVEYGDTAALCSRVVSLLGNAGMREALAKRGLEKVKRFYSWDGIAEAFMREAGLVGCAGFKG